MIELTTRAAVTREEKLARTRLMASLSAFAQAQRAGLVDIYLMTPSALRGFCLFLQDENRQLKESVRDMARAANGDGKRAADGRRMIVERWCEGCGRPLPKDTQRTKCAECREREAEERGRLALEKRFPMARKAVTA